MDNPISIPNDGHTKQVMQASIKQKLSEITGTQVDDVLPEYVMVMVANHKSKSQVAQDLDAFLGAEQSNTFTNWLWDALQAMNSDSSRRAEPARRPKVEEERESRRDRDPSPERSVFASVVTVPQTVERQRTTLDNPAPARLILNAVQEAVRSTSGPAPRSVELMREREEEQERERERELRDRERDRENRRHNGRDRGDGYERRDYNGRDNGRDRGYRGDRESRSRDGGVFDRLGTRDGRDSRDRDSDMEDTRGRGRPQRRDTDSPTLASRLGSSLSSSNNNNGNHSNNTDTTNNVFLPDTAAIASRKEGGEEDPVTFTVTLNGVKDDEVEESSTKNRKRRSFDPADEDMEEAATEGGGKKSKKEKCSFFPNCKRGEECAYFHPTQMCKSFPECTYGDKCLFIHPVIPCKFGAKCTRPNCSFSHTTTHAPAAKLSVNSALPTPRNAPSTTPHTFFPPPFITGGVKPCKHGFACPRDGCTFFHPPTACVYGDACARPGCTFAHGKLCRSGVACTTPGCSFVHAQPLKTPCKFGAGCLNTSCRFSHETPAKAGDAAMSDADDTTTISASLPLTPPTVTAT